MSDQYDQSQQQNPPQTPYVNGTIPYRLSRVEKEVEELKRSVGRLTNVILTASITLATSAVIFAVTITISRGH